MQYRSKSFRCRSLRTPGTASVWKCRRKFQKVDSGGWGHSEHDWAGRKLDFKAKEVALVSWLSWFPLTHRANASHPPPRPKPTCGKSGSHPYWLHEEVPDFIRMFCAPIQQRWRQCSLTTQHPNIVKDLNPHHFKGAEVDHILDQYDNILSQEPTSYEEWVQLLYFHFNILITVHRTDTSLITITRFLQPFCIMSTR